MIVLKQNVIVKVTKDGKVVQEYRKSNRIVDNGVTQFTKFLMATPDEYPTHMALGSDDTAATDTDTTLGTELYRAIITRRDQDGDTAQFQLFLDETEGNGVTYKESGLFNLKNDISTMFARFVFDTEVIKTASVTLTVTWEITPASDN